MSVRASVDVRVYIGDVRELASHTGRTVQKEIKVAGRGVCYELAKATQPFGVDDKAKGQGESAIKRDLFGSGQGGLTSHTIKRAGIFRTLPDGIIANATEEDSTTIQIFAKKNGEVYGTDKEKFFRNPSVGDLDGIHHDAFRNGRVTAAAGYDRSIGRWKFITRTVIPQTKGTEILAFLQDRVGWAKAAFATCARLIGDVAAAASVREIPRWIKRHRDSPGSIDDRTGDPDHPSLSLTSEVPYAAAVLSQQNLNVALRDAQIKLRARIQAAIDHPPRK